MNLAHALESLFLDQIFANMLPVASRSVVEEWLMVLSGILLFVASGLFVWSAYLWLDNNYPTEMAAAITGLIALGLAVIFFLSALGLWYVKRLRLKRLQTQISHLLHTAVNYLEDELREPVQDNPKKAAAVASLAGYAAGKKLL